MKRMTMSGRTACGVLAILFAVTLCFRAAFAEDTGAVSVQPAQAENDGKKPGTSDSERKKQMTRMMDQVFKVLNTIMSTEGLTQEEKRERALEFLRTFRYGEDGKGYLVVMTLAGVIQVEPNIQELVGKDLLSLQDPNGIKVFEEFTRICLEEGQGWATYLWPKQGNKEWHVPTVALVRYFEPLGYVVVTSYNPITIDVDDVGTPYIDDEQPATEQ